MVTLDDILAAQSALKGIAVRTPLIRAFLGDDHEFYFKPESFQPIGSFKLRGAYNKVSSLSPDERRNGVITYSSGNHAQGVAFAARALGLKSVIVMPRTAPKIKVDATAALGAEIVMVGGGSDERLHKAQDLAAEHGYAIVPPYNDEKIIAGQGTIGLEILEDLKDVELVLCPVGGGGLLSGVAAAIKLSGSRAKVIGVEPELANDGQQSFRSGKIVSIPAENATSTLADGLRTQSIGPINFEHIRKYVDDIVTISEAEMRESVRLIVSSARLVPEPSGAVTFAAWAFHRAELPQARRVVAIISGGNVEPALLAEILRG